MYQRTGKRPYVFFVVSCYSKHNPYKPEYPYSMNTLADVYGEVIYIAETIDDGLELLKPLLENIKKYF